MYFCDLCGLDFIPVLFTCISCTKPKGNYTNSMCYLKVLLRYTRIPIKLFPYIFIYLRMCTDIAQIYILELPPCPSNSHLLYNSIFSRESQPKPWLVTVAGFGVRPNMYIYPTRCVVLSPPLPNTLGRSWGWWDWAPQVLCTDFSRKNWLAELLRRHHSFDWSNDAQIFWTYFIHISFIFIQCEKPSVCLSSFD